MKGKNLKPTVMHKKNSRLDMTALLKDTLLDESNAPRKH